MVSSKDAHIFRNVSDEIDNLSLHKFRPTLLHLNIAPFFAAYLIWFFVWASQFGLDEYPELGMIVTAVIAILQTLTCLFCYWFVDVRVFMQCTEVKQNKKTTKVLLIYKKNYKNRNEIHSKPKWSE